jgi:4-alpha-glucanotransferase
MAHSGALRIDHVMGLLRQYWIPPGATALEGAYVAYPAADLLGILALESHRHAAVVIGEDLGTVPAGFTQLLERYGILSCEVLQFQRDQHGDFKPPSQYSNRALVTSTTHDHPSMASFWTGDDLLLRRKLGILESDGQLGAEQRKRARDRAALLRAVGFRADGATTTDVPYSELCAAVHRFLAQTPAPLMGVMLDDLSAELEPINIPGVPPDKHDCWRRRMQMALEEIMTSADVAKILSGVASRAEPHQYFGG